MLNYFPRALLFSWSCGCSTLHPWARCPAQLDIGCHCICLNSPAPQTMCEWVGAPYVVEAAQDAIWLTLIRRSNLDSPYYIDICIFSLSFCCNGLLRSLVEEWKTHWRLCFWVEAFEIMSQSHGEFSISATLFSWLPFPFRFWLARPQRARARFKFLVFSASSPAERKGSCILSAYSIFPLRNRAKT